MVSWVRREERLVEPQRASGGALDTEISNQRAEELTAARAEIARLERLVDSVYRTLNDFDLSDPEACRRVLLHVYNPQDLRERLGISCNELGPQ